jgi:pimeloyl-ACP methyl ester carboxylesterase
MPNAPTTIQKELEGWAEVRAHDRVVRYRRSGGGAGPAVLLAQPHSSLPPLWPEFLELIARGSRLIIPDPPADEMEVEAWLGALLEGLGIRNLTVVATDGFCIAALERAMLSPEQVARMILITSGRGSESAVDGKLAMPAHCADVPFLVLRRDRPASDILPMVESFLRG